MSTVLTTERLSELEQRRSKLHDEAREQVERAEKEDRGFTPAEDERRKVILGEINSLTSRISTIQRQLAVEGIESRGGTRVSDPLPHEDASNVGKRHRYSMMRAIRNQLLGQFNGLEREVSDELQKRTGKTVGYGNVGGFAMPYRTSGPLGFEAIRQERERILGSDKESRALDAVVAGGGSVPTILEKDWIELLRNSMKVKAAGMREIMDLTGKFAIPRQNAAATAYWVAEGGAPTGTNQTLDQVLFTPHTIGAFTDVNRRFFELTILDSGEEFVKEDLTAVLARGIDLAALNGSGASNQPLGILQNTAITATRTVSLGTNGGAPTWASMVELFTIVSRGNAADLGEFTYIGNADVQGTLATTAKIGSTFPIFLLEDGKVYGKTFLQTQQLPNNLTKGSGTGLSPIVAGIFNQIVAAYWSGVDILVDPYTGSSSGTIRIVALQDMDIQIRHPEAFSVVVDMASDQTQ